MAKRMTLMLLAMAALITALGAVKFQQVQAAIAQASSFRPPPEAVTTSVASRESWPVVLGAIGTVNAVHGVTVSADLPGMVEEIAFESGRAVQAGDLLVQLDTRQERAQLAAAEARRDLSRLQLDRMRGLRRKGVVAQAELDAAEAEHSQALAQVGEVRATIDRKTIRAPFTGILGIRQADLGQYMSGGDAVVPLQSLRPIHVDFSLPQHEAGEIGVGTEVLASARDAQGTAQRRGQVTAVDSIVNEATRNLRIQATFDNENGSLRPGMFVEVRAVLAGDRDLVTLPASAVRHAPYGESVFIVEEITGPEGQSYRGARQQFVRLGPSRGDQIAVLEGVKPGEEVATSGVFKLRHGAAVLVNNDVQPANDPAPRPENS